MSGYTKGPWQAMGTVVYFPDALGGFDLRNCPEAEKNALLCAAAPDLLEALESVRMMLAQANPNCSSDYLFDVISKAFSKCDAAIDRAKGEKP